jgi:hypothetical protein
MRSTPKDGNVDTLGEECEHESSGEQSASDNEFESDSD